MAIIKYQLDSGRTPEYISDGGYFIIGNDYIGIGSGGGTEMTKSELNTYILSNHSSNPYKVLDRSGVPELTDGEETAMSNSQVTAIVNAWCTARGIS